MTRLCFVCLGNICRSPTAAGVMRHIVGDAGLGHAIHIDSAGTGAWHVGEPPDRRATAAAAERGFVLDDSARRFEQWEFDEFDLIVAMDQQNHADLVALAPDRASVAKIRMLREFDPEARSSDLDVPDPYYGGKDGFAEVLDMVEAACRGLLEHIR